MARGKYIPFPAFSLLFSGLRKRFPQFLLLLLVVSLMAACASAPAPKPAPPLAAPSGSPPFVQPPPQPPPAEVTQEVPSGSLWSQTNGSLFQDIKAKKIGDILTITVSEESKGSKEAATTTSKDKTMGGSFNFSGASANGGANKGAASFGPYSGDFKSGFTGSGSTSRTDSMTAYMTATVVGILPNGNLIIRGSRSTKVNNDIQQTVLEGVVRPMDVTRNNTVLSQNIAEAKIFLVGKGPVTQQQKPGWLLQVVDFLSPF
ncbi:MAG: flagellar basal body L-ring protein FlgH [Syntrophobacteraceae bacterium]